MKKRRVVVTGLGTVNPIGLSVQEFWNNALAGVSAHNRRLLLGVGQVRRKRRSIRVGQSPDRPTPTHDVEFTVIVLTKAGNAESGI